MISRSQPVVRANTELQATRVPLRFTRAPERDRWAGRVMLSAVSPSTKTRAGHRAISA